MEMNLLLSIELVILFLIILLSIFNIYLYIKRKKLVSQLKVLEFKIEDIEKETDVYIDIIYKDFILKELIDKRLKYTNDRSDKFYEYLLKISIQRYEELFEAYRYDQFNKVLNGHYKKFIIQRFYNKIFAEDTKIISQNHRKKLLELNKTK